MDEILSKMRRGLSRNALFSTFYSVLQIEYNRKMKYAWDETC